MCPRCGQWENVHTEPIPDTNFTTQPTCIECDEEMGSPGWAGGIDWVIAGCESGHGARACNVEWLRVLRDACRRDAIPFFLKQATYYVEPDATTGVVTFGDGSIEKGLGFGRVPIIELPYLDNQQHADFPAARED